MNKIIQTDKSESGYKKDVVFDSKTTKQTACLMNVINDAILIYKILPYFGAKENLCTVAFLNKKINALIPLVTHNKLLIKNDKIPTTKVNANVVEFSKITFSDEIIQKIRKRINIKEEVIYSCCDFKNKIEIIDIKPSITKLSMTMCNDLNTLAMENLKFTNIRDIFVTQNHFTSEKLDCVFNMKKLESLGLLSHDHRNFKAIINGDHITKLSQLLRLKKLRIAQFQFNTDNCDTRILGSLQLDELAIMACTIKEKDVLNLIASSLKKLNLCAIDITDDFIMFLSNLKKNSTFNLEQLSISYCPKITNESLEYLNDLNLLSLTIEKTSIDDLSSLHIPSLLKLDFRSNKFCEANFVNIFDMPFRHLTIGRYREYIYDASEFVVTSTVLKKISEKCRSLKELHLCGIGAGFDDVIKYLSGMNFDKLSLHDTPEMAKYNSEGSTMVDQFVKMKVIKNHKSFELLHVVY